jgi:hypothetical protein
MSEIAVLIVSCDKYQDLWQPFFTLFFKYWPECPYPVYLLSNYSVFPDPRVKMITVGEDKDWSSGLATALQQILQPYVILLLEDYLLTRPVDTAKIQALATYIRQKKAGYLRLFPCPGPDAPCADNPDMGEILRGSPYRLSTQAAIWDRQVLSGLLREGETPGELEVFGSRRTDTLDVPFLSVKRDDSNIYPISYFCTAVVRGKWVPAAVRLCRNEGIQVDLGIRPLETRHDRLRRYRVHRLSERVRAKCMSIIRHGGA